MNLVASIAIAALVGAGVYVMLARDLIRVAAGALIFSNSAILYLMAGGFDEHAEPLAPMPPPALVSDPLVQVLALTAIVINFGTAMLLLRLGIGVARAEDTLDIEELAEAEIEDQRRAEEPR